MSRLGVTRIVTNPLTDKLRSGQAAVGSWLSLASPIAAESMAHVGWDFLMIDAEHSLVGFETMVNCFRAIQLGGAVPIARVPWNDTIWIQRTLDAGALGLVVPMVNTAEDARRVVSNMKFAAKGLRSYGGSRMSSYIEDDYIAWTDQNLAIMVMIETVQAVANAEAILAVDGVTGCMIGPSDLALSMGISFENTGPGTAHENAILSVLAAAQRTGKAAGKACTSAAEVNERVRQGFQFLAVYSDASLMIRAALESFAEIDVFRQAH